MHKPSLGPIKSKKTDHLEGYSPPEDEYEASNIHTEAESNDTNNKLTLTSGEVPLVTKPSDIEAISTGETEAQDLLKRTPGSYMLNQIYGLWFFISWFFLTVIITREVSTEQYGIFAVAMTAYNTILYIVALGLEDATTTYVPRVFAEQGKAAAANLVRRMLALRLIVLVISVIIMLFGLPVLATLISLTDIKGAATVAAGLRDPLLLSHIVPITIYVFGSSIASLLTALCAALMRMQRVFVIGSVTQFVLLGLGFVVLQMGWSVNGVIWLLAISSLFNAAAYAIWFAPFLFARGAQYKEQLGPVVKLGLSAWLTNLVTGALLKQTSIILLGIFAVSIIEVGYFNLSFQLADAANLLLVAGFQGVGSSALAAAFIGSNHERLSRSWQALIKVETLLAAPGLVFCLFNASNIAHALYGSRFDAVGPLLAVFLFFNLITRVLGTTIHQSTLYVVGKARLVVIGQWLGMLVLIIIGIVLIGFFKLGPTGALVADGIAKALTGLLLLIFLWKDLPHKYPVSFTLRFLLALVLAALPGILWPPSDRIELTLSGMVFLVLCFGLLVWIKPLDAEDMLMLNGVNPKVVRYLRWFARS
jgi:O-antigen/teichoic acid export membrane protein